MADPMTPSQLHAEITKILAAESGCPVHWGQHSAPLDAVELIRIWIRTAYLLGAEIDRARARKDFALGGAGSSESDVAVRSVN